MTYIMHFIKFKIYLQMHNAYKQKRKKFFYFMKHNLRSLQTKNNPTIQFKIELVLIDFLI